MTGHFLGDAVLFFVGAIVVSWMVSALCGWVYLAWLLLPSAAIVRRITGKARR